MDTWSQILTRSRIYSRDTSATQPGVTDARALVMFNARYRTYYAKFESRLVRHTGGVSGLSLQATSVSALTSRTDYARFHACYLEAANNTTDGTQLRIFKTVDEALKERSANTGGELAPSGCAFYRIASTDTAQQGKWRFEMSGASDGNYYISLLAEVHAADVALANDVPDVTPEGSADLAALLGYDISCLLNRPEDFKQGVLAKAAYFERVMELVGGEMADRLVRSPAGRVAAGG